MKGKLVKFGNLPHNRCFIWKIKNQVNTFIIPELTIIEITIENWLIDTMKRMMRVVKSLCSRPRQQPAYKRQWPIEEHSGSNERIHYEPRFDVWIGYLRFSISRVRGEWEREKKFHNAPWVTQIKRVNRMCGCIMRRNKGKWTDTRWVTRITRINPMYIISIGNSQKERERDWRDITKRDENRL